MVLTSSINIEISKATGAGRAQRLRNTRTCYRLA